MIIHSLVSVVSFIFHAIRLCFSSGQIAALTGGEQSTKSPLAVEMYALRPSDICNKTYCSSFSGHFVMMISIIAILFAVVFFAVGITTAYKGQAAQTVTFAVSILVAFVPEGLPSVVTLL